MRTCGGRPMNELLKPYKLLTGLGFKILVFSKIKAVKPQEKFTQ